MNNGYFKDKTVVVTGASSGIGWHTARLFAQAGAKVLAHCHRNCEGLKALTKEGDVSGVQSDLSTPVGIEPIKIAVHERLNGRVDVLVNNAGSLLRRARFLDLEPQLWDSVLALNLSSAYWCARAFLPSMLGRKEGSIINVSSIAGRNGGGLGAIAYSAAKGGLIAFSKGLAREFTPQGIRVNAVSPGTVDTNYHKTFSTEQMIANAIAATPMGRMGSPEEVAEVIVFLASPAASYISGETIEINGGALMD
jgi:3-oxoacyl-[acyl-carrier protein] reductase